MNFFAMQKSSLLPDTPYTVQSLQIVDYFIRIVYTVRYAPNILLHYQLFCITKKFIFAWQVPPPLLSYQSCSTDKQYKYSCRSTRKHSSSLTA
ncbi:AcOrf-152 peptide [Autographa californica nucleopolyhedrovirus]|uniref:Protein AC152 n=2 Tax=Autographa californica nuclear polyhedrosis virus TaxID=46015 RepID=AC152_NPVAC|nr:AcOrf-152 peptide [Autographa californica nucleopolyhedrovirus]P41708.1 RecName: Full=Protein AC152 [Autographa californica nucleopolyhedrovirus]AKN59002.1 AcOrf-152 peptide [Autographa californica multiple nucleopolyhedrovirus]ARJ58684.1 Orf-152 protein [synthetic baculovirus AcMNPV-WIV-Syn1]UVY87264.1 Acorf152 protein [synthetic construct]AAA66782.1 AcOrf-152 peptide [Autographa californica nucleopolyhedrovirus]AGQ56854.1 hypothetical protein bAcMK154 [Autographa californica nucleopolyhe